jgi:acyl carrier protein
VLLDCGYGAAALCLALEWPGLQFVAVEKDTEKLLVARHVADGRVNNITFTEDMKEMIRTMLEDALPLVDFDADFLFSQLDSLGVTTILMTLSDAYGITLDATDATPRNLMSLDAIATLVETKLKEKGQ